MAKIRALSRTERRDSIQRIISRTVARTEEFTAKRREELPLLIKAYEEKYGMTSAEAARKLEMGELAAAPDIWEWMGLYAEYQTIFSPSP